MENNAQPGHPGTDESGCAARGREYFEELAGRLLAYEEQAIREFIAYFGPRFRRMFLRRGLPEVDAEDLADCCVTDIIFKIEKYGKIEGGNFEAWVFTLARREIANWYRKRPPTEPFPEGFDPPDDEEGNYKKNWLTIGAVRKALAQLSESDRRLIELRYQRSDMKFDEIGKHLDQSAQTTRVRHHRALKRLERILEQDPRLDHLLARAKKGETVKKPWKRNA